MDKVKKVFNNIKNKKTRLNKTTKKQEPTVTSTNIEVQDNTFVDLHMKVARKVDTLIDEMDQKEEENKKTIFKI